MFRIEQIETLLADALVKDVALSPLANLARVAVENTGDIAADTVRFTRIKRELTKSVFTVFMNSFTKKERQNIVLSSFGSMANQNEIVTFQSDVDFHLILDDSSPEFKELVESRLRRLEAVCHNAHLDLEVKSFTITTREKRLQSLRAAREYFEPSSELQFPMDDVSSEDSIKTLKIQCWILAHYTTSLVASEQKKLDVFLEEVKAVIGELLLTRFSSGLGSAKDPVKPMSSFLFVARQALEATHCASSAC